MACLPVMDEPIGDSQNHLQQQCTCRLVGAVGISQNSAPGYPKIEVLVNPPFPLIEGQITTFYTVFHILDWPKSRFYNTSPKASER